MTAFTQSKLPQISLVTCFSLLALMACTPQASAQDGNGDLTGERLVNARKEPQNWATYFGAYDAWRYSSLDQIRADNVKNLVPVWVFQTGKVEGGLNATPIVVDGIMYLIASENRVFALNAETGERMRIMPRPTEDPYSNDEIEKRLTGYYYRYKPGQHAPEGRHSAIVDKPDFTPDK